MIRIRKHLIEYPAKRHNERCGRAVAIVEFDGGHESNEVMAAWDALWETLKGRGAIDEHGPVLTADAVKGALLRHVDDCADPEHQDSIRSILEDLGLAEWQQKERDHG